MNHVRLEDLESLSQGMASEAEAAEVEAHVSACEECARELAWLRAERALMARRPQPATAHLWPAVEARLSHPRRRPRWAFRIAVASGVGVALAASLLVVLLRPRPATLTPQPQLAARPERPPAAIDPKTLAALDRAEADYRNAAKVLEEEYARLRPRLDPELARRWDETLTRARAQLGESRAVAADDVNVRMRVLDGYAGYLRSLRDVVQESEEANP